MARGPPGRVNFAGEVFASASQFPLKCPTTAPMH